MQLVQNTDTILYSQSSSDWYDSNGAHHFYINGQEYVGDPNAQHMTVETAEHVRKYGMGD